MSLFWYFIKTVACMMAFLAAISLVVILIAPLGKWGILVILVLAGAGYATFVERDTRANQRRRNAKKVVE